MRALLVIGVVLATRTPQAHACFAGAGTYLTSGYLDAVTSAPAHPSIFV